MVFMGALIQALCIGFFHLTACEESACEYWRVLSCADMKTIPLRPGQPVARLVCFSPDVGPLESNS